MKLWDKTPTTHDTWMERYTVGRDAELDQQLVVYDVLGTLAHAKGLSRIGVLTEAEFNQLREAFQALLRAYQKGDFRVTVSDEDVHTAIERFLTDRLGVIGQKIHTGRSRNDQVLVALRLFTREQLQVFVQHVLEAIEALLGVAEKYREVLLPGYTHMQPAMPSSVGLWALSYAESFLEDLEQVRMAYQLNNRSPLGSAAGYGVPYLNLPRKEVAEWLGFDALQVHVAVVQLSRGKIELAVANSIAAVGITASRLAADLIWFSMPAFGFVELPEALCTGSSIMPQKKNPDVLELTRGRVHRLFGEIRVLQGIPAGLPSGYHRDLQLTKEPLMRVLEEGKDMIEAVHRVSREVRFIPERCLEACSPELFATAEALKRVVEEQVPFREAYRHVGQALESVARPPLEEVLKAYRHIGSPGNLWPEWIQDQLVQWRRWLEHARKREEEIRKRLLGEDS